MPKGVYERKKEIPDMASEPTKLFPVLLNKNYAPKGEYEIVGYLKEAVKVKDAAGTWKIVEPEEFIEGEMRPAATPGTGFPGKVWSGTTIRLPVDEAKSVVSKKIAERADAIAA